MKELYTKPVSQIDEFKTYDEVLTASYTGGNTGIDVVLWINSRDRVDRRTVDVRALERENIAQSVNRTASAVKDAP